MVNYDITNSVEQGVQDHCFKYGDGIYKINRSEYSWFCQNVMKQRKTIVHWPGDLYLVKHDGFYMFFIKSNISLCFLRGARRKKVNHDLQYYYDNLPKFGRLIKTAFASYQLYLTEISREVRSIGGNGRNHGSIIDIDFYNHIYLDPMTGNMKFYWADSTYNRRLYSSIIGLLSDQAEINSNSSKYQKLLDNCNVHSMSLINIGQMQNELRLPDNSEQILNNAFSKFGNYQDELYYDHTMYKRSNAMFCVQRLFKYNVAVFWNDDVLKHDLKLLPISKEQVMKFEVNAKSPNNDQTEQLMQARELAWIRQQDAKKTRELEKKRKHREKIRAKDSDYFAKYVKKYSPAQIAKYADDRKGIMCKKYQKAKYLKVDRIVKSKKMVISKRLKYSYWLILQKAFELNSRDWNELGRMLNLTIYLNSNDKQSLDVAYKNVYRLLSDYNDKPKFNVNLSCNRYGIAFAHIQLGESCFLLDFSDDRLINAYALDDLFRVNNESNNHLAVFKVWMGQVVSIK